MARNYAALPHEYLEELAILSDEEFGRLCRALLLYSMAGEESTLPGAERVAAKRVYMQEKRFQDSYDSILEARREGGRKRAQQRKEQKAAELTQAEESLQEAAAEDSKPSYTETNTDTEIKTNTNTEPNTEINTETSSPLISPLGDRGFGPELTMAIEDWLRYKQERHQGYKPRGKQALLTQIDHYAHTYGEGAVARLIRQCMASNWQGLIFDKLAAQPDTGQAVGTGMTLLQRIQEGAFANA